MLWWPSWLIHLTKYSLLSIQDVFTNEKGIDSGTSHIVFLCHFLPCYTSASLSWLSRNSLKCTEIMISLVTFDLWPWPDDSTNYSPSYNLHVQIKTILVYSCICTGTRDTDLQHQWTWQCIFHILTSILILMSSEPIRHSEPAKLHVKHMQFHRQLCQICS